MVFLVLFLLQVLGLVPFLVREGLKAALGLPLAKDQKELKEVSLLLVLEVRHTLLLLVHLRKVQVSQA